ncbi:hypothetical protein Dimus_006813, partial [Dionaea muscipula]
FEFGRRWGEEGLLTTVAIGRRHPPTRFDGKAWEAKACSTCEEFTDSRFGKGKENDAGIPKLDSSGEILGDPALEDPAAGLIEVPVVAQDGGCDSGKKTPLHGVIKEVDAWGLEQEQQKPYLRAVRRGAGSMFRASS